MSALRSEVLELFAEAQWMGREFALVNGPPLERRRPREPRPSSRRAPRQKPAKSPRRGKPVPYRLTPAGELYCSLGRAPR